jgi:very-short-patch-repair endonuclease
MIIKKTITIKTKGCRKIKYYKSLGYEVHKDEIEIKIEHISKGSRLDVDVSCDFCNKEVNIQIKEYFRNISNGSKYACCMKCGSLKAKETSIKKYGVDHPMMLKEIQESVKKTNIEKYGVDSPRKLESVKEKAKQTNLKKYGVENPFGSKQIKEKIKQTNLEKYGVEYPGQSKDVKEKIKQTNLEKYGVEYYFQSSIFLKGNHNKSKERFFKNLKVFSFDNLVEPLFDINEYYGVKEKGSVIDYKWKCKKCNNIFYDNIYAGKIPRCQKCFPTNESVLEVELRDFISQYIYVESHNRKIIKPYEIDILIPERKIAIEFNGLYWHSEINGKHKNYHLNKQKLAKEKGYDLIHVFENEWINKKDIVSSILLSRLNIYNEVIYARKTVIKPVSIKERR